jgi:hypothetical protein
VSVYGGYFNGGLGILLLALYQATGVSDLREANALKNLNSLVLSAVSVLTFAWAGQVHWPEALGMAVAAIVGGYLGRPSPGACPPAGCAPSSSPPGCSWPASSCCAERGPEAH